MCKKDTRRRKYTTLIYCAISIILSECTTHPIHCRLHFVLLPKHTSTSAVFIGRAARLLIVAPLNIYFIVHRIFVFFCSYVFRSFFADGEFVLAICWCQNAQQRPKLNKTKTNPHSSAIKLKSLVFAAKKFALTHTQICCCFSVSFSHYSPLLVLLRSIFFVFGFSITSPIPLLYEFLRAKRTTHTKVRSSFLNGFVCEFEKKIINAKIKCSVICALQSAVFGAFVLLACSRSAWLCSSLPKLIQNELDDIIRCFILETSFYSGSSNNRHSAEHNTTNNNKQ